MKVVYTSRIKCFSIASSISFGYMPVYLCVNDRPNGTNRHDFFEGSERNLLKHELTAQHHRDM